MTLTIRSARPGEAGLVLAFIRELAEYEKLADAPVATEDGLRGQLFGEHPAAEVLIAEADGEAAGFDTTWADVTAGARGLVARLSGVL